MPDQPLHVVSTEVLKELHVEHHASILTTTWVVYESLSRLRKFGSDRCRRFAELIENPPFTVEPITEDLETRAVQRFWRYQEDKEWSIVDCSSFEFMYDRHILYAFAADHHFKQASRIPLIELHDGSWRKAYESIRFA